MSVRNAGTTIREARQKAGLSQEKLSEGVCSVLSLSRIENGTAGVSPSTFQALMAHAGAPCEAFPIFANRTDFDCFYSLKRARFYLDCWQLKEAYEELSTIEAKNFAENKFHYQEWCMLYSRLLFRSGCADHLQLSQLVLDALHISRPDIDLENFRELLLSINELELLILYAQEALYLGNLELCLSICMQISSYLENSQITFLEKDLLIAKLAIVYGKYLIATKDFDTALKILDKNRLKMIKNSDDEPLHELTFLTGLVYYYQNKIEESFTFFKTAFYSAHSIGSCYSTVCRNYLLNALKLSSLEDSLSAPEIELIAYPIKKTIDSSEFSDGTYDLFSPDVLTIGSLIRELRLEQNIPQQTLCQGLCSKSKLSKIENGTLQPDVALSQSLLQRLGISDAVFTFYGNEKESALQNLRLTLTNIPISNTLDILKYTTEMLQACSDKDILYKQYASYRQACCIDNNEKRTSKLFEVLLETLPGFSFNNTNDYCLSWLELTILNNYCLNYSLEAPSKGILCMYKLLEYYNSLEVDILEKKRTFPITLHLLVRFLYREKRFSEIIELNNQFSSSTIKCSLIFTGLIYSHYAQALAETRQIDTALIYATYAYYNFLITNSTSNAINLKDDLKDDFDITLF